MKNDSKLQNHLAPYLFDLPENAIARYPSDRRADARLLVIHKKSGRLEEKTVRSVFESIEPGDLLVRNTTKVSRRRVFLHRENGGEIETLFLEKQGERLWKVILRKGGRLKTGEHLRCASPSVLFRFFGRADEEPFFLLSAENRDGAELADEELERFFEEYGELPIPPYLKRSAEPIDTERYQTLYAQTPGSVAAPTAGLHFDPDTLAAIEAKGGHFADLELQIGYGTFAPLRLSNFETGRLHTERYLLPEETVQRLKEARRIVAIGTTTLRALESNFRHHERFEAGTFETDLFVHPPDTIHAANGLLTNFHLPGSSLFMLVCAFAGTELMQESYRFAIRNGYRFFSYGDATLIVD